MRQSMTRVIRPGYQRIVRGQINPIESTDYIEVPRLSTFGIWRLTDLLSPKSMAALYITHIKVNEGRK